MHAAVLLLSFDMEKAERCFDSFQTVIERKGGEVGQREREMGGGGCGREGILDCSMSH